MKTLEVERDWRFNPQAYVHRNALEADIKKLVREDTVVTVNGEPQVAYFADLKWKFGDLVELLKDLRYDETRRTGGLQTRSRVFGYQPRIAIRRDFCTATSLYVEENRIALKLNELALSVQRLYARTFSERFALHNSKVLTGDGERNPIREEWRIPGTVFTSGIINKNNPLKYHYDAGNLTNVNSCMLAFKGDVGGGYLATPELDGLGFEIGDRSLLIFDGQSILHGVTPIKKFSETAYRFSLVFYSLVQMWRCEPLTAELARIRKLKSERERKRSANVA